MFKLRDFLEFDASDILSVAIFLGAFAFVAFWRLFDFGGLNAFGVHWHHGIVGAVFVAAGLIGQHLTKKRCALRIVFIMFALFGLGLLADHVYTEGCVGAWPWACGG